MQVKIPYKPRDLQAEMHNKLKKMECAGYAQTFW